MEKLRLASFVFGAVGIVLFIYAIVGRFVNGPTVLGYVYPLDAKTLVLGANSLLLIAIFLSFSSKQK